MLLTVPPGKRHSTTHRAMWGSTRVDQELERSEAKAWPLPFSGVLWESQGRAGETV